MPGKTFRLFIQKNGAIPLLAWTFIVLVLAFTALSDDNKSVLKNAEDEARDYYRLNLFYRAWASRMGGVYVPIEKASPNQYLQVSNRDIVSSAGNRLTLINPAYMTRLVFDSIRTSSPDPVISKLTSVSPLNPDNAPDAWERESLAAFERKEYQERSMEVQLYGKPYLRFISSFITEQSCLKCHGHQGYHVGDVRGAITISVPLGKRLAIQAENARNTAGRYAFLWVVGTTGIVISSRRRFNDLQGLRSNEEKFRTLFEHSQDAVFLTSPDGTVINANQAACQIFGMTEAEIVASGRAGIMNTADGRFAAALQERECTGRVFVELTCIRKNGEIFPAEVNSVIVEGKTPRSFVIIRDITDRKKAEEELRHARALLQAAMDCSPAGIIIADAPNGLTQYINDAALELHGLDREIVCNGRGILQDQDVWQLFQLDGTPLPQCELPLCRAIVHCELNSRELMVRRTDGQEAIVVANAAPIRNEAGSVTAGIVVFTDITDQVRAQSDKAKLEGQLLQAQKLESIGLLAGGVAHDFNNMLTVILGQVELALLVVDEANQLHSNLREIRAAVESSAGLTRQLLAFARQQAVSPKVLDLNEVIEGMLKMLRRLIGENVDLLWTPGRMLWPTRVDPAQIDQILANMCINARDAIAGVGNIIIQTENRSLKALDCATISESYPGEFVVLIVTDTGRGMTAEVAGRIFEPFFTTKEIGKGTGLGLATVYGIVRQNNGFIEVKSQPQIGTTFRIFLPRHVGDVQELKHYASVNALPRGNERVLLVEDDPAILKLAKTMLTSLGYEVVETESPEEAVRWSLNGEDEFDLLISDVVMPKMNGRDLYVHLKNVYPGLKCLFVSGYTGDIITSRGVLDPEYQFLQKPFSLNDLAKKVRETLGTVN